MKWELKEPIFGDIVRVKVGSIYHYGIYATDEEIIQFGLSPALRKNASDADVTVCTSNVEDFLTGGFLEVGVVDRKDKKRLSANKTVDIARSRIGEAGYNILHNNCEHFAHECFFGEKFSTQTDSIRALFRSTQSVDVYLAEIPSTTKIGKVQSRLRQGELSAVTNEKVKREKYYVWKLLEHALQNTFKAKPKKVKFEKSETGKWLCDVCEFSLSHSHNTVVVAVCKTPVGVDIEKIEPTKLDISHKILSDAELSVYNGLSDEEKTQFIIGKWTKKESLFKQKNQKSMGISGLQALSGEVFQKTVTVKGEAYSLSVTAKPQDTVRLYENVDLTKL